jgi:hypothetical protein
MNIVNTTNSGGRIRRLMPVDPRQRKLLLAVFLIGVGVMLLLSQWLQLSWLSLLILPLIGIGFLAWGIFAREVGLMIPGGILLGIGGAIFVQSQLLPQASGLPTVALIMFGMAAGLAIVALLSPLAGKLALWPVFPALIFALFGMLFLGGEQGLQVLITLGQFWPVILIIAGVAILVRLVRRDQ